MLEKWCLTFLIKKYELHNKNLKLHLRLGLKQQQQEQENTFCIKIKSITMAKTICQTLHAKKNRSRNRRIEAEKL